MKKITLSILLSMTCLMLSSPLLAQEEGKIGNEIKLGGDGKTNTPAIIEYADFYLYSKNKSDIDTKIFGSLDTLKSFISKNFSSFKPKEQNSLVDYYSSIKTKLGQLQSKSTLSSEDKTEITRYQAEIGFLAQADGKYVREFAEKLSEDPDNLDKAAKKFFFGKDDKGGFFSKSYEDTKSRYGLNRIPDRVEAVEPASALPSNDSKSESKAIKGM
jgi:hypothetical protein